MTPTQEQLDIIEAARLTEDNLLITARAGAAKTTTLVMLAEAMPEKEILCLAFNKKIAEEMSQRLPPNCEAKTRHGLGYRAWWQFLRKPCRLDKGKVYRLLKAEIERLEDLADRKDAYDTMAETLEYISMGKNSGYLPTAYKGHWRPLVGDDDFFLSLPFETTPLQQELIRAVSQNSFREALDGVLDFDDMVFCPSICSAPFPTPQVTLVDEAQDLSPLNHHMLKKIVKRSRLIAVGDPCQAIYGFRGADKSSMTSLAKIFETRPYYLTISFRCSKAVCTNARWLAPDMQYPDWAEDGLVQHLTDWSAEALEDGDAILCRNNAPLFTMAIRLIRDGRLPELSGVDIGQALKKIMKKFGKPQMHRIGALDALSHWEETELRRARPGGKARVKDNAACLRVIIEQNETLGDAMAYLDHMLQRDGRIRLMTGHKSKGLEFPRVWFLDPHLCKIDRDQDANVKYVIETRAMQSLFYVDSDMYEEAG